MKTTDDASEPSRWSRYQQWLCRYDDPDLSLDVSRTALDDAFLERMAPQVERAFQAMRELEAGAIANPDEDRMVGHYWLRNPALAPDAELRRSIEDDLEAVESFARAVHAGEIAPPGDGGARFTHLLVIGIGGSALGPQLVADCLAGDHPPMAIAFFDNTDPDGMRATLEALAPHLATTLVVVISKSGGTPETRNGLLVARHAWEDAGLAFARHAVAITGPGSRLDAAAVEEGWTARFPMADWVGGRTSVTSVVGLLPAALQGIDIRALLAGAAAMDARTRSLPTRENAAMLLALAWHRAGDGRGRKDMVVLPYKDRLVLLSRYLQQLVMESLGKERDLAGEIVNQGIAVYGNKGSTDQHAYVQQLRDGVNNFFVTFIEVRESGGAPRVEVEPGVDSGDYLQGFLRGTRTALAENGRESITLSVPRADAASLGALIALFERAVGFYASLVGINAYHQPGVEAGKKAAGAFLEIIRDAAAALTGDPVTADGVAAAIGADPEDAFHALVHLAANDPAIVRTIGRTPADDTFHRAST